MKLTNKQVFDILSYAVKQEDGQEINVYYAIMADRGVSTLTAYHMRKIRKQLVDATALFFEMRDAIVARHTCALDGNAIVYTGDDEQGVAAIAAATREINELLAVEVDDIRPLKLSCLLEITGTAREYLIEYDALTVLDPLIENDVD